MHLARHSSICSGWPALPPPSRWIGLALPASIAYTALGGIRLIDPAGWIGPPSLVTGGPPALTSFGVGGVSRRMFGAAMSIHVLGPSIRVFTPFRCRNGVGRLYASHSPRSVRLGCICGVASKSHRWHELVD